MTRWLITGANGQLGTHLRRCLADDDVIALGREQLDISDAAAVEAAVSAADPAVVLNAAAYTGVDAAEDHESEAMAINRDGPLYLANALRRRRGRLVHISTDYVFAGNGTTPYEPDDETGPLTAYGRTKLAGERAALAALPERTQVVRTAWVFGGPGANFVDTMRRLERERESVDVVADQIGSPTSAADLARALIELGRTRPDPGVLHYVNSGTASWYDLARETFRLAGADPERVRPTDTSSFPRPAPRPFWSVLSANSWHRAGLRPARPWQEALADAVHA